MPDFDIEIAKKHIADYLESLDENAYTFRNGVKNRNPVFRNIRKYVEKKMSLPRNSLNDQKKELKKICAVRMNATVHYRKKLRSCALLEQRRRRRKWNPRKKKWNPRKKKWNPRKRSLRKKRYIH